MSQNTPQLPGLHLLNSKKSQSTTDMPLSQAAPLRTLEEWLNDNPEPVPEFYQALPRENIKAGSPMISPIPFVVDGINWVGKLHSYWARLPAGERGTIEERALNLPPPHLFTCAITISESPVPFGGSSFPFLNKKNAKQHAAKQAVEYLVRTGRIVQDTILKEPSKNLESPSAQASIPAIPIENQSTGAQVNFLAHKLGFKSPTYVIELVPESTAMYSGYAEFVNEPLIEGKVGDFRMIWSKKAAKEGCAQEVLEFLKDIERHRDGMSTKGLGVSEKRKLVVLESPEMKKGSKISRYDGCDKEEEEEEEGGDSEYGTPEP